MRRTASSSHAVLATILLGALVSCSKDSGPLHDAGRALSAVSTDEAALMAGANKRITMIVPAPGWMAASTIADDFVAASKKRGVSVTAKSTNVGDPMAGGFGWKSADFFAALAADQDAGVIVSFVGAPLLQPAEFSRVTTAHPPILVVATAQLVPGDQMQLARLLDARIIQAAIIDGADPSAARNTKADAAHEFFAQHYRILRRPD